MNSLQCTMYKNPLKNLLHKLKSPKFPCFALGNLFIAPLLTAFHALIREILTLFSSHMRFIKGFYNFISSPKIYRGIFPSLIFIFFACEIPTEVYNNPLDTENDVFETPAMVFFPDTVTVNVGGSVTLNVFAMEVDSLAGSYIQVNYDKNKLQVLSVSEGATFSDFENLIFFYENDPTTGTIDIYTSFLGGDTISVSGTGSLANLVMTTIATGQSLLTYSSDCEFVNPDDTPIEIKGFTVGVVNAQ